MSLLVTGQTQNANAMAISSDQVIGYLSGEVLGVTGRALGLDALRVERGQDVRFDAGLVAGETDPSSRLTFGKQVTRNVEVVFSQSLKDSGKLTWIIGYRPRPNIEIRFVSQDNETRIVDFRHDVTIGGGPVAKAPASRPASRVASVRVHRHIRTCPKKRCAPPEADRGKDVRLLPLAAGSRSARSVRSARTATSRRASPRAGPVRQRSRPRRSI